MSINWRLDAEPKAALLVLPPAAASLDEAHAAIELWEHYSGKTLDATQVLAVEVMMAESAAGRWAAATTGREMPRQNGKGDEIEVVELWGLVQRSEAILHTVHEAVLLASQAQQRLLAVLDKPDLRRRVKRTRMGVGQQMIEMRNGGIIWYRTRTGGGGRGLDEVDRLVVDEAQHAAEEHLASVSSTLLASPNPQLNAMGTSAIMGKSDWWWGVRKRALGDDPGSFGYVGHTAEVVTLDEDGRVHQQTVDVTDRANWIVANPAVTAGRSDVMEFLEEEFRRLAPESFAREHLGVWDPQESAHSTPKLPQDEWAASAKVSAAPAGRISLAFDVDLDSDSASVVIAAGTITAPYVELVRHQRGTAWLAEHLVGLVDRNDPLAVGFNDAGPAKTVLGEIMVAFRDAGLSTDLLAPLGASDYRAACGAFYAHVAQETLLRPTTEQKALDLAASDATERPLAEGWVWHRRQATVPISPLVAATVACHLLPTEAPAVVESDFLVI